MNSDTFFLLIQRGFHIGLGATASLVETLQDPQKREQNFSKLSSATASLIETFQDPQKREQNFSQLNSDFTQLTTELAEKGAITEQEARTFVDTLLSQQNRQAADQGSSPSAAATPSTPGSTGVSPSVQAEIQELTSQLAAMRLELEKLRNESN